MSPSVSRLLTAIPLIVTAAFHPSATSTATASTATASTTASAAAAQPQPAAASARAAAGTITGRVADAVTGAPLVGADVALEGTPFTTATDATGAFRLSGVPEGKYVLLVLYLGHADGRSDVSVTAGRPATVDVKLPPAAFNESVQVRAEPIGEGQARALNQQRTALEHHQRRLGRSDRKLSRIRTRPRRRRAFPACRSRATRARAATC